MNPSKLAFVVLLLLSWAAARSSSPVRCHRKERRALLGIKAHFDNDDNFASWTPDTVCCAWAGVDCDPGNGHVIGLRLYAANITGTIPPEVEDLPSLIALFLHHLPNLVGGIPSALAKLTNLTLLDLSWNSLSGPVPSFLSEMISLMEVNLSYNMFSGEIPPALAALPNLLSLRLDRNRLSGTIPDDFGSFLSPPELYLSHNNLSGEIPPSLGGLNWPVIDLSRNMLSGDAVFLFGDYKRTLVIDLSRNHLLAFDLTNVSFPANLTALDLNHNMISGTIPPQINQLPDLAVFNVSYNRLCGEIPPGNVTAVFDESAYAHNPCLCGWPMLACD